MRTIPAFLDPEARAVLENLCEQRGIDIRLIEELASTLGEYSGRGRADGLNEALWDLLGKHVEVLQASPAGDE